MDISTLNSPADLAKANELTPLQTALKACADLCYSESRQVSDVIVEAAVGYHEELVKEAFKKGDTKAFFHLTKDLARLETALIILKEVS